MTRTLLALTFAVVACNGGTKATAGKTTVGAKGGTVSANNGDASLVIPPGALDKDVELSITESSASAPDGYTLGTKIYKLEPEGTTFAQPVTITLKTTGTANKFYWSQLGHSDVFDELTAVQGTGTISASNTHFSLAFGGDHETASQQCTDTTCGNDCANLQTSAAHCGSCEHACASNEVCTAGTCARPVHAITVSVYVGIASTGPVRGDVAPVLDVVAASDGTAAYNSLTELGTSTDDVKEYVFQVVEDSYRVLVACNVVDDFNVYDIRQANSEARVAVECGSRNDVALPAITRNIVINGVEQTASVQQFSVSSSGGSRNCNVDSNIVREALCYDPGAHTVNFDAPHGHELSVTAGAFDLFAFRLTGDALTIAPRRNVAQGTDTLTFELSDFAPATSRAVNVVLPAGNGVTALTSGSTTLVNGTALAQFPSFANTVPDDANSTETNKVYKVWTVADSVMLAGEYNRPEFYLSGTHQWNVVARLPKNAPANSTITIPEPWSAEFVETTPTAHVLTGVSGVTKGASKSAGVSLDIDADAPPSVTTFHYHWYFTIDAVANSAATYDFTMHTETSLPALSNYVPTFATLTGSADISVYEEVAVSATSPAHTLTVRQSLSSAD